MSPIARSTTLRRLALASALLASGLAVPAAGHAQALTPERTLLNSIAIPSFTKSGSHATHAALTDPAIPSSVEGTRALLGRTPPREHRKLDQEPAAVDSGVSTQIDGARALLGRWTDAEIRRPHYRREDGN